MHKLFTAIMLSGLLIAGSAQTQPETINSGRLSIAPEISILNGSTIYEIDANAVDPSAPDSVSRIRSKLDFPLDVTLIGASAAFRFGDAASLWEARVSFRASINDPSDLMTDEDWIDNDPVSYTESSAEGSALMLSGRLSRTLLHSDNLDLNVFAGAYYQRIKQDIIGFDGWQDLDRNGVRSPIRGDDSAIVYEITYFAPEAGAHATMAFGRDFSGIATASAGLLFGSDTDDHLLRGVKSEGDGTGVLLNATGEFRYRPPVTPRRNLWIGIFSGVRYHYAKGNVTKTWYRDEGSIPAGTVDRDLPYTLKSTQTSVGVRLGVDI